MILNDINMDLWLLIHLIQMALAIIKNLYFVLKEIFIDNCHGTSSSFGFGVALRECENYHP